jgi:Ca2+-binding RTX toxin-like protein
VVPSESKRILVQGNYQAGIAVVDFTNPAQAKEIAYADPAPLDPNTLQLGGDWSSYWYNGYIYESDITRGLIDWKLNDPAVAGARMLGHLNPQTQEQTIPFTGEIPVLRCRGKAVTLLGSAGNDVLKGTPGADVIFGDTGNDRILGKKGNDILCGGPGNDLLKGGAGNDILLGQAGNDTGKGGKGTDTFRGGPGKDKGSGFEKGKP